MADLTTVAKVKEYLGITDSAEDALLARLVAEASAFIRLRTAGRAFAAEDIADEVQNGKAGQTRILPKRWPVVSVAEVKLDGTALSADSYTLDDGVICLIDENVPEGAGTVSISYRAGSDADTVASVEGAAIVYAALLFRGRSRFGHSTVNVVGEDVAPEQGGGGPQFAYVMDVIRSVAVPHIG